MNIWNLLPPALVTRAKEIVTLIGVILFVVVSFFPSLAVNHYIAVAIAVLTALGAWTLPASNSRSRLRDKLRTREPAVLPDAVAEKTLQPPVAE